ncbi:MAG: cytosine permease, partial [Microbacterium sp.]|uniref:purine-cytosine permease family protein n=1 Tax=Microbacterium sp. TaxID=51671 RepID=UPI0027263C3F
SAPASAPEPVLAPTASRAVAASPTSGPTVVAPPSTGPLPSGPLQAVPVADTGARSNPPALRVEASALEPTPVALRAGRSIRLFWLWFAVNSSVVSVGLGGILVGLGMSLRQAILSALVGVAVSFLPLGLGTLAGKWSGQPTMVISRATFGIVGNLLPAVLAVVTRLLWAAILLGMLGAGVAEALVSTGIAAGADPLGLASAIATIGLVLAAVVAGFGYGMIAIVAAVSSVVSGILVVLVIALTAPAVDMTAALAIPDGDWVLVVTGAVLVFSVVGLAWANSSGDLARYQSKGTIGAGAVLFASFGATIPAFALIGWGSTLASSDPELRASLATNPVGALVDLLPGGLGLLLVLAIALSLTAAAALALYSGGFALLSTGLRTSRPMGVLIGVVLTGAIAAPLVAMAPSLEVLVRDVLTTLAVPVAAWAGIFGAETMIRTRRVHSPSLLQSGGVYPPVRWVNTVMLVVASVLGWGFTSAAVGGLDWQGYLWASTGGTGVVAESDAGVAVALLVGLLTPIVAGIPAVRRLQLAEYRASLDS